MATGAGAALIPAALNLSADAQTSGLSAANEQDYYVLNFALMLEYLEANFYSLGIYGRTLPEMGHPVAGFGPRGPVIHKANTKVPFTSDEEFISQYLVEITTDEINHVEFLRVAMQNAGLQPGAAPKLDLMNSFNTLASAAGIANSFDPYASGLDFLIGGYIFEDVGVTAYHGAATLISSNVYLQAAAGILAVEAYHASVLRTKIFEAGNKARAIAGKISKLRRELGHTDQGVLNSDGTANITLTDANGIAYARTVREVMNIVFGKVGADKGLFFPDGMNLPAL